MLERLNEKIRRRTRVVRIAWVVGRGGAQSLEVAERHGAVSISLCLIFPRPAKTRTTLTARATPVPAARNQILNQSIHTIREPVRPGPRGVHRGAHRRQPASKSRASSL